MDKKMKSSPKFLVRFAFVSYEIFWNRESFRNNLFFCSCDCVMRRSISTRCWLYYGFDSRPKPHHTEDFKSSTYSFYLIYTTLIVSVVEMPWPKKAKIDYHAQFSVFPDKGRTNKSWLSVINRK